MPKKATKKAGVEHAIKKSGSALAGVLDKGVSVDLDEGDFSRGVISTGSTLLDLAISGNRIRGGGLPGGVFVEIYGPSSSGKTALLAEIGAGCKYRGGVVVYDDPEARFDREYAKVCGLDLSDGEYNQPQAIEELKTSLLSWDPKPPVEGAISVRCVDSLAAFSSDAEMSKGHKMAGAKRAALIHELCRAIGALVNKKNWIVCFSNQEQVNFETGARTTPGGTAVKYWASIRIRLAKKYQKGDIKKTRDGYTKIIGVSSIASIKKNSCDDPFREAPIHILFGRGVDDVRGNLEWLKEMRDVSTYDCFTKSFKRIDSAISYIEEQELERDLRDVVIDTWQEIESKFVSHRKRKVRF